LKAFFFFFCICREGREKRRWEIEWEREGLIQNDEQREREGWQSDGVESVSKRESKGEKRKNKEKRREREKSGKER
jgi:hypothetical protein